MTNLPGAENMTRKVTNVWVAVLACMALSICIRVLARDRLYPCPGDGTNFIQYGIAYANGIEGGLNTYMSQGMTWLASLFAHTATLRYYGLQYTNIAVSALLVAVVVVLGYGLFDLKAGWLAGLLVALNPSMTEYGVSSYSEIIFMFWAYSALMFLVLFTFRKKTLWLFPAGLLLGLATYFKGLDAQVWLVSCCILVLFNLPRIAHRKAFAGIAILCVSWFAVSLPLFIFTYQEKGVFQPGSKAANNVAGGPEWMQSQVIFGLEREPAVSMRFQQVHEEGVASFLLKNPEEVLRRYRINVPIAIRTYIQFVFMKAWRVGTSLALVLCGLAILVWLYREKEKRLYPLLAVPVLLSTGLICLCFIHDRLLVSCLPLLLIMIARLIVLLFDMCARSRFRYVLTAIVILYLLQTGVYSAFPGWQKDWRLLNMAHVGSVMREFGTEDDVIMHHGPAIPLTFFRTNMLNYVRTPYCDIETLADYSQNAGATLMVVSDDAYMHWPVIKEIINGALPPGWELLTTVLCEGIPEHDVPSEKYLILKQAHDEREVKNNIYNLMRKDMRNMPLLNDGKQ